MADAHAISAAPVGVRSSGALEQAALYMVFGVAATLPFSIAISQSLLAIAIGLWLALVISHRERVEVPRFFWPLAALAVWTLVSAAYSRQPRTSFADAKQLLLFLVVPVVYRLATGRRGHTMITVLVSAGAATAMLGIFQFAILDYDIHSRPRGSLGHYMTYSGLVMLLIGVALARILFGTRERLWAALVMPALAVAVAVTFTRNAWVGAFVGAAVLLSLKDFRLIAVLPIVAALFFATAPASLTSRFVSIVDINDPTNRDRLAMLREGRAMVGRHPLVGVGPAMVEPRYAEFRDPGAVEPVNPHLHNVPVQIAAERGLPALACWLAFVGILLFDLGRTFRSSGDRSLTAAAIAATVAMLAAGLFEYNFGDSEFLMMLLIIVTLPFAAHRPADVR
jgi:O-antigen ligase